MRVNINFPFNAKDPPCPPTLTGRQSLQKGGELIHLGYAR